MGQKDIILDVRSFDKNTLLMSNKKIQNHL